MADSIKGIESQASIGSLQAAEGINKFKMAEYGINNNKGNEFSYNLKQQSPEKQENPISYQPQIQAPLTSMAFQAAPVSSWEIEPDYDRIWKPIDSLLGLPDSRGMNLDEYASFYGMPTTDTYNLPYDKNTLTLYVSKEKAMNDPTYEAKAQAEARENGLQMLYIDDLPEEIMGNYEYIQNGDNKQYFSAPDLESVLRGYNLNNDYSADWYKWMRQTNNNAVVDYSLGVDKNWDMLDGETWQIGGGIGNDRGVAEGREKLVGSMISNISNLINGQSQSVWNESGTANEDIFSNMNQMLTQTSGQVTNEQIDNRLAEKFERLAASNILKSMSEDEIANFDWDLFNARTKLVGEDYEKAYIESYLNAFPDVAKYNLEESYNWLEPKGATASRAAWDRMGHDEKMWMATNMASLLGNLGDRLEFYNSDKYKEQRKEYEDAIKDGKYTGSKSNFVDDGGIDYYAHRKRQFNGGSFGYTGKIWQETPVNMIGGGGGRWINADRGIENRGTGEYEDLDIKDWIAQHNKKNA